MNNDYLVTFKGFKTQLQADLFCDWYFTHGSRSVALWMKDNATPEESALEFKVDKMLCEQKDTIPNTSTLTLR